MPRMTFIERDGTRREVEAALGASVLQVARRHDIDIEGACEGSLACSTCHVIVDPEWYDLLQEPSEDEDDMLDLAFNLTKTSRLGCQIIITDELDGLTVRQPGISSSADPQVPALFARLVEASEMAWRAYTRHQFVLLLSAGDLPEAC